LFKNSNEMLSYLEDKMQKNDLVLSYKNIEDFNQYSADVRK